MPKPVPKSPTPRRTPADPALDPGAHDLRAAIAHPGLRDLPPTVARVASAEARWAAVHDAEGPTPPAPAWRPDAPRADDATTSPDGPIAALLEAWERRAQAPPSPAACDVCGEPYTETPSGRLEIVHRLDRHERVRVQLQRAVGPVRIQRVDDGNDDRPVPRPRISALARLRRTMGERDED